MPRPSKHQAKVEFGTEPPRDTVAVADDGQIKAHFDELRVQMLERIGMVEDIIKRRCSSGMQKHLLNIRENLKGLEERVKRNELPVAFLRILMNDARLDALILLSRVKVTMLYEHQRLLAPTEKLRSEIEASIERWFDGEPASVLDDRLDTGEELTNLNHDFEVFVQAEKSIRDQELEPCSTSTTDGEKRSNLPSNALVGDVRDIPSYALGQERKEVPSGGNRLSSLSSGRGSHDAGQPRNARDSVPSPGDQRKHPSMWCDCFETIENLE